MARSPLARLVVTGMALGTAAAVHLLVPPSASASDLPAPTLSKSTVQRGESFTISGTGCHEPDYDRYSEEWLPYDVGVISGAFSGGTQPGDDGFWSLTMDVGGHLGPGSFPIRAWCSIGGGHLDYPTVTVTVVGEPLPPKWWEVPPRPGGYTRGVPASPPAGQSTTPRTTAPSSAAPPAPTSTPPASTPPASATPSPAAVPTPVPGCTDCEKLTGDEPVIAGAELTLRYSGFQPGEQVTVVMRSTPVTLGTFTADAAGTLTAEVTIPTSAETGTHTLTLSGPVTGDHVLRFRLTAAAQDRATVAAPAADGTDLRLPMAIGGAGLVLLVVGALVLYRRRAAQDATSAEPDRPAPGQPTETPISEPIP
jgi:hypothetical protein